MKLNIKRNYTQIAHKIKGVGRGIYADGPLRIYHWGVYAKGEVLLNVDDVGARMAFEEAIGAHEKAIAMKPDHDGTLQSGNPPRPDAAIQVSSGRAG